MHMKTGGWKMHLMWPLASEHRGKHRVWVSFGLWSTHTTGFYHQHSIYWDRLPCLWDGNVIFFFCWHVVLALIWSVKSWEELEWQGRAKQISERFSAKANVFCDFIESLLFPPGVLKLLFRLKMFYTSQACGGKSGKTHCQMKLY